jgi:hypothetical protein
LGAPEPPPAKQRGIPREPCRFGLHRSS